MIDPINQTITFKNWMPVPGEALIRFQGEELEQTSYRPTVVICLGGTGLKVARQLNKLIGSSFGEDEREIFQFIVFDTAPEDVPEGEDPLAAGDFVHLGAFDAAGIIRHIDENPYIAQFWPGGIEDPYPVDFSGDGAHRVRAVGRLVLFHYINQIVAVLRDKIDRAISVNAQHGIGAQSLKFYIVCSLAGGTGSGMVLDMAHLARKLGLDTQFAPYVTGVLVTDDPFVPQVETTNTQAELSGNTYAALREINHFFTTRTYHEHYNKLITTTALPEGTFRPFDVAYLLGMHNKSQALESFDALIAMIAAELMLEIASPMENATANLLDNLRGPRRVIAGQPTPFSSFAFSSIVYPLMGISSWCALRAHDAFTRQVLLQPTTETSEVETDVSAFMQAARIEEAQDDQLLDRLNLDDKDQPMASPALSQSQVESLPEEQLQGMMQHLEETRQAETAAIREQIIRNVRPIKNAFTGELHDHAETILRDPQRGSRYTSWILSSLEATIAEQRDTHMMGEQAMYTAEVQKQEAAWQAARTEMSKALLLPAWLPTRGGRIARARDRRVTAFNALQAATIEREKRTQAVQCQNHFVNDTAALSRRANDLVHEWEKLAQTAGIRAQGEITKDKATKTQFSLMYNIVSQGELERTYEHHLPQMEEAEQRENLASRFWQHVAQHAPDWSLASDGLVLSGEANPAVQTYYFLADWYADRLHNKALIERLRDTYGDQWEREIEMRYKLTEPFWRYTPARHASEISNNLEKEPRLVGYGEENIDSWSGLVKKIVNGRITSVKTRNPHQLLFLRTAHGLPLFAMPDVTGRMRQAYMALRWEREQSTTAGAVIPLHISEAWELRDIDPLPVKPVKPPVPAQTGTLPSNGEGPANGSPESMPQSGKDGKSAADADGEGQEDLADTAEIAS